MKAIVAVDKNFIIGNEINEIPWPVLKPDMEHFRKITTGHTLIMGRKTYESLGFRPLADRPAIVLTRDRGYAKEIKSSGGIPAFSVQEALLHCRKLKNPVFVIGGADIYQLFDEYITDWYVTHVQYETKKARRNVVFNKALLEGTKELFIGGAMDSESKISMLFKHYVVPQQDQAIAA